MTGAGPSPLQAAPRSDGRAGAHCSAGMVRTQYHESLQNVSSVMRPGAKLAHKSSNNSGTLPRIENYVGLRIESIRKKVQKVVSKTGIQINCEQWRSKGRRQFGIGELARKQFILNEEKNAMNASTTYEDIMSRLDDFKNAHEHLRDTRKYTHEEQIVPSKQIVKKEVSRAIESFRASLDYLLHDQIQAKKLYFPLCTKNERRFKHYMKTMNREIPEKSGLYAKLEDLQYYKDVGARAWMKILSELANDSKHSSLLDLEFKIVKEVKIHHSNGYAPWTVSNSGSLHIEGSTKPFTKIMDEDIFFEGTISVANFEDIQHPNISLVETKLWYFTKYDLDALSWLATVNQNIRGIVDCFYNDPGLPKTSSSP